MCEIQSNGLYVPLSKDEQKKGNLRDKTFIKLSKLKAKMKKMQRDVKDAEKNNNEKKTRASLRKFELLKEKFNKNVKTYYELLNLFNKLDAERDALEEKAEPKPKAALKAKTVKVEEKKDDISYVIDNFDDPYLHIILEQTKYNFIIKKIEDLIDKINYIIPGDLFFNSDGKKILGGLYSKYKIEHIDNVLISMIKDMGGKPGAKKYSSYIKNLPNKTMQQKLYNDHGDIGKDGKTRPKAEPKLKAEIKKELETLYKLYERRLEFILKDGKMMPTNSQLEDIQEDIDNYYKAVAYSGMKSKHLRVLTNGLKFGSILKNMIKSSVDKYSNIPDAN
jgi:hypothetical protein